MSMYIGYNTCAMVNSWIRFTHVGGGHITTNRETFDKDCQKSWDDHSLHTTF